MSFFAKHILAFIDEIVITSLLIDSYFHNTYLGKKFDIVVQIISFQILIFNQELFFHIFFKGNWSDENVEIRRKQKFSDNENAQPRHINGQL